MPAASTTRLAHAERLPAPAWAHDARPAYLDRRDGARTLRRPLRLIWDGIRYDTRFTPGGFQVPSPTGRIEGGVSFGQ